MTHDREKELLEEIRILKFQLNQIFTRSKLINEVAKEYHTYCERLKNKLHDSEYEIRKLSTHIKQLQMSKSMGEYNGSSKLKLDQVIEIKKLRKQGLKLAEIGKRFNVTYANIQAICSGKSWKLMGE